MRHWLRKLMQQGTGNDSTLWPVLLLLLIVLVPSAGVVWMMRAAMDNERLAVRQRLAEAYEAQLEIARSRIGEEWHDWLERLDALAMSEPPSRAFAECVRASLADSAVILDAAGRVAYPVSAPRDGDVSADTSVDSAWIRAERLEFADDSPAEAAEAYRGIATGATDPAIAARARQAQARALIAEGDSRGAIRVLKHLRSDDTATDTSGRSLAADAELRLLELLDRSTPEWQEVAASLARRLADYDAPLNADQRIFLMNAFTAMSSTAELPTLDAEVLAAKFLAQPQQPTQSTVLTPTGIAELSQVRSPSGRVVALVLDPTFKRAIEGALAAQRFPDGVTAEVRSDRQVEDVGNYLVSLKLAPWMPGWRLVLSLSGSQLFDTAANERMAFFGWMAVAVVAITAALALLVANLLRRQLRLTRLKNDLVATVSHELKTPLASIRLLVDTLLNDDHTASGAAGDPVRTREYLEMIANENSRLSRLIDNFLTFSRMERGKHHFDFQPADAADVVDQAVAAVAERFDGVANKLNVDIERPLPLDGDVDALVTVVVNLLDNAWKYSDEPREIGVSARRAGDRIVISVTDHGIGLSPRAVRKVFDRFYQVDQHLSRSHDGCGLGLSIVKHIVAAHGGEVGVESRLGEGSKFSVSLPLDVTAAIGPEKVMQAHR